MRKAKDDLERWDISNTEATIDVDRVIELNREQNFVHDGVRSFFKGLRQTDRIAELAQSLLKLVLECENDKQRLEEKIVQLQRDLSNERAETVSLRKLINVGSVSTTRPDEPPKNGSDIWRNLYNDRCQRADEVGKRYKDLKARFDASNIYGLEKKTEELRTELIKAKDSHRIADEQLQ